MLDDPWALARLILGEPLHPGGSEATEALLDRAGVTRGTRLLDVGCGGGEALSLARQRGARAVGLDRSPQANGTLRGDLDHLPMREGSFDVVLSECVVCLSSDFPRALTEARRVLDSDGRLALSDVVVEGDPPAVPVPVAEALCLTGRRSTAEMEASLERVGFEVNEVRDHQDDLLAMRDRAKNRVDYVGLLGSLGDRGEELLDGIERLETAVENGAVSYFSFVGSPTAE